MALQDFYAQSIIGSQDFESSLSDYLLSMPKTRASAEELLDTIIQWDDIQLYSELLTEYAHLLRYEEKAKLIRQYRHLFDLPLPDGIEEV